MKFNDNDYEQCLTDLRQEFNKLNLVMDNIETSLKKISNTSNWSSSTRDIFNSKQKKVVSNFDTNFDKQVNILEYLENVEKNYVSTESNVSSVFSSLFNF